MALALLWADPLEEEGSAPRLHFDIGHNYYYAWQIGDEERINTRGITRLANVKKRSRVFGPLPDSARGRGVLEIPSELISKEERFVQLLSFRTEDGAGPAISAIAEMDWTNGRRAVQRLPLTDDLPPPAFLATTSGAAQSPWGMASALAMSDGGFPVNLAQTYSSTPVRTQPVDVAPLRWRERDLSQAMFFQGLLSSILPSIAPMIGSVITPVIGQLFGGSRRDPAGGGTAATSAAPPGSPSLGQLIEQLLRGLGQSVPPETIRLITAAIGGGTRAPATPTAPAAASSMALGSLGARAAQCVPRAYSRSRSAKERERRKFAPQLSAAQGLTDDEGLDLKLRGNNFMLPGAGYPRFPIALLNGESVQVVSATHDTLHLKVPQRCLKLGVNQLSVALDPYAVVNMEIKQR